MRDNAYRYSTSQWPIFGQHKRYWTRIYLINFHMQVSQKADRPCDMLRKYQFAYSYNLYGPFRYYRIKNLAMNWSCSLISPLKNPVTCFVFTLKSWELNVKPLCTSISSKFPISVINGAYHSYDNNIQTPHNITTSRHLIIPIIIRQCIG